MLYGKPCTANKCHIILWQTFCSKFSKANLLHSNDLSLSWILRIWLLSVIIKKTSITTNKKKSSIGDWNGAINDNTLKDTSISCVPFKVKQDVWVCSSSASRNPSERITCNDFSHINVNCGHAWLTVVTVTLDKSMSGMVKQN